MVARFRADIHGREDPFPGAPDGRTAFCIQQVDEARTGKNRMHLDLTVEDLDGVAIEVVVHGGSQRAGPFENEQARWSIMADPEGNEFCLITLSGI